MRQVVRIAAVALVGSVGVTNAACGAGGATPSRNGPTTYTACTGLPNTTSGLLAVTASGMLIAVNPTTLRRTSVATDVLASGGLSVHPERDTAYVTSIGADGRPAIWTVSTSGCHKQVSLVEPDAELPSVSPDGGRLAFVMLDTKGLQTGVALVNLGATGVPEGALRRYPASSVPPVLPITGIAVAPNDGVLAVWGGFVDRYLGITHPTVGTLDPSTGTSLSALAPVFDEDGISMTAPQSTNHKPEDWQSAPTYLPNGEFLVGDGGRDIMMPFTDSTAGGSGGGMRTIDSGVGPIESLAAGPGGSIAWVSTDHRLTVASDAVDLPFGPQAETVPRQSRIPTRTVPGTYTSVAWAIPPSEAPLPVAVFHIVDHLPSVVGLSEAKAASVMGALDLPVFVGHTEANASVSAGTVLAQDPPAGVGVACQCSVVLTVAS